MVTQIAGNYDNYLERISAGKYHTHEVLFWGGYQIDAGASYNIINPNGLTISFPSSAAMVKISSSSVDDTAVGTGARTIFITGLNSNYDVISEIVTMNGRTAVNTINSYIRVNGLRVLTAGSGNSAAGSIYAGTGTVTAGVPDTVYNYMTAEDNSWNVAIYTVPRNYKLFLSNTNLINGDNNLGIYFSLNVRVFGSNVFWASGKGQVYGATNIPFTPYFAIDEKTDLTVTSKDGGGTQGVYALVSGYLRSKDLDI